MTRTTEFEGPQIRVDLYDKDEELIKSTYVNKDAMDLIKEMEVLMDANIIPIATGTHEAYAIMSLD